MIRNFLFFVSLLPSLLIAEVIIDVRTPEEYQSAHLDKAINIEWQNILSIKSNYNKTEKISLNIKPENSFEKLNKLLKAYNNYSPKNSPKNSLKNSPKIQNKNIILTEKKITNRMLLFDYLKFNYFIKSKVVFGINKVF